jgi:hypothetical protein
MEAVSLLQLFALTMETSVLSRVAQLLKEVVFELTLLAPIIKVYALTKFALLLLVFALSL